MVNNSCSGIGCCQTHIPDGIKDFNVRARSPENHSKVSEFNPCSFAFVVEEKAYKFFTLDLQNMQDKRAFPLVLDWAVGKQTCEDAKKNTAGYACKATNSNCVNSKNSPGYLCNCFSSYQGNPYLFDGCQDIDECKTPNHECDDNACVNHMGSYSCSCPMGYQGDGWRNGSSCTPVIPKPSNSKNIIIALCISISLLVLLLGGSSVLLGLKRRKFMKLQEKYFQQNGGLMLQEHILNHGRSMETTKIFSNDELKKATNNYDESRVLGKGGYGTVYKGVLPDNKEVAIKKSKVYDKSQIEQFINEVSRASPLSSEKHLKIATETARALAYLHFETSMPIIHRDVKSTNILLDDNHTAKVADFGASRLRLITLDQTEITTLVQGTLGYLDPEYFQTGQLTEKSDVYSFGVVLAELLTGEEAISTNRPETYKNLAMYFVSTVKEDRLLHILQDHIVNEGNIEPLKEVANLAKGCLRLRGEDRPTMMEVAMELEGLRNMEKHTWGKDNQTTEETEYLLSTPTLPFNIDIGIGSSASAVSGHDSMINQLLKPLHDGR
ncbi:wall-associated receptor kinase 2-like [Juglans microcarpa x Juglans regia]|uniref:wall-associated receptor kinase 2-like n=1 Tax=Juglans microcarpa x Juglans regia TaxID=2249226 RepID=UPI001B7E4879|nr:wall-associated receptor kinase 2-like [Juglans microcarpa x Juglans regia]